MWSVCPSGGEIERQWKDILLYNLLQTPYRLHRDHSLSVYVFTFVFYSFFSFAVNLGLHSSSYSSLTSTPCCSWARAACCCTHTQGVRRHTAIVEVSLLSNCVLAEPMFETEKIIRWGCFAFLLFAGELSLIIRCIVEGRTPFCVCIMIYRFGLFRN